MYPSARVMIKVRVPASSANMGAGFDSLGVALNLYSRIAMEEISEGLEINTLNTKGFVPKDENNLIYRSALKVFEYTYYKVKGIRIIQDSSIPMTRGLGSSSACIIGGMLAANIISGRKLSYTEILNLASQMEGHPDNAAPALYGGFCVSLFDGMTTITKSTKLKSHIKFAVMIPDYFIATKKSRGVLPETVSFKDAAFNIAHASMFQAALISGDTEILKEAVKDKMHQQYRKNYVDGFDEIFAKTYEAGSKATYLSGSGPTIVSILDDNYFEFNRSMKQFFKENSHEWNCMILSVDNVGAVVSEAKNIKDTF